MSSDSSISIHRRDKRQSVDALVKGAHHVKDVIKNGVRRRTITSVVKTTKLQLMVPNSLKGISRLFSEKLKKAQYLHKETQTTPKGDTQI